MWRYEKEANCVCLKKYLQKFGIEYSRIVLSVLDWCEKEAYSANGEQFASICLFFPCWNKNLDYREMKTEVRINSLQSLLLAHFVQIDKFLFNCIYYKSWSCWICVLLYLGSIKKMYPFLQFVLLYFNCSKLKQMFRI